MDLKATMSTVLKRCCDKELRVTALFPTCLYLNRCDKLLEELDKDINIYLGMGSFEWCTQELIFTHFSSCLTHPSFFLAIKLNKRKRKKTVWIKQGCVGREKNVYLSFPFWYMNIKARTTCLLYVFNFIEFYWVLKGT